MRKGIKRAMGGKCIQTSKRGGRCKDKGRTKKKNGRKKTREKEEWEKPERKGGE